MNDVRVAETTDLARTAPRGRRGDHGRWQWRRICAAASAVCLFPLLTGCYTYRQSVSTEIGPGTDVSLTITDEGRVKLAERLGRGVLRVNGRVVAPVDSVWELRVFSVDNIGGGKTHWAGEDVRLSRTVVSDVATREFSRRKTWLAVGITVGAVALLVGAGSLIASGIEGNDTKPPRDGQTTRSPSPMRAAPVRP